MRIIGIDPGLQRTGWGIIAVQGNQLSFIAAGTISTETGDDLAQRLNDLHAGLVKIIGEFAPGEAAIEETFVNKSGSSTLKLGQARGALLLTVSLSGLNVCEYAANVVKKSVTGSGHAGKEQVTRMVQMLLPGSKSVNQGLAVSQKLGPDAMDALAVAICHAQQQTMSKIITRLLV